MHLFLRRCLLGILLTISGAGLAQTPDILMKPSELLLGASQEEWSRRWWQWAMSFDDSTSPVADTTGRMCGGRQAGEVWFLAGTYGTRRTVRTCRIPAGRYLFFPLINYITYPAVGSGESCTSLTSRAARLTQNPAVLVLEVNGKRFEGLEQHRQPTKGCFPPVPGNSTFAAGDGYYIAIKPLPPGTHTLDFGGILPRMAQAVTYTLLVE